MAITLFGLPRSAKGLSKYRMGTPKTAANIRKVYRGTAKAFKENYKARKEKKEFIGSYMKK
jgi:hypothetical protein